MCCWPCPDEACRMHHGGMAGGALFWALFRHCIVKLHGGWWGAGRVRLTLGPKRLHMMASLSPGMIAPMSLGLPWTAYHMQCLASPATATRRSIAGQTRRQDFNRNCQTQSMEEACWTIHEQIQVMPAVARETLSVVQLGLHAGASANFV